MSVAVLSETKEKSWVEQGWPLLLLPVLLVLFIGLMAILFFLTLFIPKDEAPDEMIQGQVASGFPQEGRKFLPIYMEAAKKYNVPWQILAAIHKVETDFDRDVRTSYAGAIGSTQWMPASWVGWSYPHDRLGRITIPIDITDPKVIAKGGGYGVDANGDGRANPYDPVDAINATAKFLAANHKKGEDWFAPKGPVWQYNHDYTHYVLKVKEYADQFVIATSAPTSGSGFLFPVPGGRITSPFGMRYHPIKHAYRMHEGVDIGKGFGAPIFAAADGVVVEDRAASGYGWIVVIQHPNGLKTLYGHMYPKDVKVHVGDHVTRGQVIALMGSNGISTGAHVHFEVRRNDTPIDPMPFIKQ